MKRSLSRKRLATAILSVLTLASATAQAQAGPDPNSNSRHSRIVGVWDVQVSTFDCATGAPRGGFASIHSYARGGTGQVVPAGNPTGLSAHMMVWSYAGKDEYVAAIKFFRYDAAGTPIGYTVINNVLSLNEAADGFIGEGQADFYDMAGIPVPPVTLCPESVGTRFTGK